MAKKIIIDFNLNKLSASDILMFFKYLDLQKAYACTFLKPGDYYFRMHHAYVFKVRHGFFFTKKGLEEYELFFQGEKLAAGSFGALYDVDSTYSLTPLTYVQGGGYRPQVLKVQSIDHGLKEFRCARQAPHLNIKVNIENTQSTPPVSCIVMDKMPGQDLWNHISQKSLTVNQLLQLCVAIPRAINTQITAQGLIHRDIKIENIMVFFHPEGVEVNIIDLGLSLVVPTDEAGVWASAIAATLSFVAKEIIDPSTPLPRAGLHWHTVKMDVFSLGRVLGELCGVNDYSYYAGLTVSRYREYLKGNEHLTFKEIFTRFLMPRDIQERIKNVLTQMLVFDPIERISMAETASLFEAIYEDFKKSCVVSPNPSLKRRVMQVAELGRPADAVAQRVSKGAPPKMAIGHFFQREPNPSSNDDAVSFESAVKRITTK